MLIEVTTIVSFNQWCNQALQKMCATPVAFSRLTRQVQIAARGATNFWVVSFAAHSTAQKLKPEHNTVSLLIAGSSLERKYAPLPAPLSSTHAIDMTENNMTQTMIQMGLSGA